MIVEILKDKDPDTVFDELLSNDEELKQVAVKTVETLRNQYGDYILNMIKMMALVSGTAAAKERVYLILYNGYRSHPVLGKYVNHPRFKEFVSRLVDLVFESL